MLATKIQSCDYDRVKIYSKFCDLLYISLNIYKYWFILTLHVFKLTLLKMYFENYILNYYI